MPLVSMKWCATLPEELSLRDPRLTYDFPLPAEPSGSLPLEDGTISVLTSLAQQDRAPAGPTVVRGDRGARLLEWERTALRVESPPARGAPLHILLAPPGVDVAYAYGP